MITTEQIRKLIEEKKVTIGADATVRALRSDMLKTVIVASNASDEIQGRITRAAEMTKIPIDVLTIPNDQLGTMCKKPFAISFLGIKR